MKNFDNRQQASSEELSENMIIGRNAVRELLKSGRDIDKIFVSSGEREGSITVLVAEAVSKKIPVMEVERRKLSSMAQGGVHQGIIAMAAQKQYSSVDDILDIAESRGEKPFIVIADGICDPHNLGALIRCCEGAGVHGIIIPKRNSCGLTPTVYKASAGALENMAVAKVSNIAMTVDELKKKGLWIFGAEAGGENYFNADFKIPCAVILGSEGEGISKLVLQKCDFCVSIPMLGKVNSLNVSTAASVILYEAVKQRKY